MHLNQSVTNVCTNCNCMCHENVLLMQNELTVTIQNNQALISENNMLKNQLSSIEIKVNEMLTLHEKNGILHELVTQYTQKYKAVVSQNELLKLHQKYAANDTDIEREYELQNRADNLQKRNDSLQERLVSENDKFNEKIQSLQKQLKHKNNEIDILRIDNKKYDKMVINLKQQLITNSFIMDINDEINTKNETINELKEKLCFSLLANESDDNFDGFEPHPIVTSMNKTLILDKTLIMGSNIIETCSTNTYTPTYNNGSYYAPFPTDTDDNDGENDGDMELNECEKWKEEMREMERINYDLMEEIKELKTYINDTMNN